MNRLTLTVVLAALSMIGPFAMDTYLPSFLAIEQEFLVGGAMMQQTLSAYLGALAVMGLLYGALSDSFGRRPVVLGSLGLFFCASIGASLAPGFGWLLFFRCVQGLSAGAGVIISQAIVRDVAAGVQAQQLLACITTVFGLAPAVAPIVGGYLHVHSGWRSIFAFLAVYTLLLLLACHFCLVESLPATARHPFRPKALLANYRQVAGSRVFLSRACAVAFLFGGMGLYIASAAAFVINILHARETSFALLFVPIIGGLVAGSLAGSRLSNHFSLSRLLHGSMACLGIACVLNLLVTATMPPRMPWVVLPIALYTFGLGIALPVLNLSALDIFPQMRGMAASLLNCIQMAVFALVSGLIAPLLFDSAFRLASGQAVCCVLAIGFWRIGAVQRGGETASVTADLTG